MEILGDDDQSDYVKMEKEIEAVIQSYPDITIADLIGTLEIIKARHLTRLFTKD